MKKSTFNGTVLGFIGTSLLAGLVSCVTLGILSAWSVCYVQRWYCAHTTIDEQQLVFDGNWTELLVKTIIWALLSVITIGIYSFWAAINMQKWITEHTHVAQ